MTPETIEVMFGTVFLRSWSRWDATRQRWVFGYTKIENGIVTEGVTAEARMV